MKRKLSLIALVAITSGALVFTGCKKDDTTPPVITLVGPATENVTLNGTYTDQGATAEDDEDGPITPSITVDNPVDVNNAGTYTVTYTVADAAGNTASATRTVIVSNSAANLGGSYHVTDVVTGKYAGTYNYDVTVTPSSTQNNVLTINGFAGLGTPVNVSATVSGSTLTISTQNPSGMQDPGVVSGSGTISGTAISNLTYTINYNSGGTDNGSASLTKF